MSMARALRTASHSLMFVIGAVPVGHEARLTASRLGTLQPGDACGDGDGCGDGEAVAHVGGVSSQMEFKHCARGAVAPVH